MCPQIDDIQAELKKALQSLAEQKGIEITAKIKPILYTNLDRGRIQGFIEGEIERVYGYVWGIAENYTKLNKYLHKLQVQRSTNEWEPLFKQLQTWAYSFFLRKNFKANVATQEIAMECASEAAISIMNSHFPYDTEFEPWAHVIVLNTCRKYIRKASKKSTVPQNTIIDIDGALNGNLVDPAYQNQEYYMDLHSVLSGAVAQLSIERRQVIGLMYFDEFPPDEVAKQLGKSVGAIYCLKFNALQDLRKILGSNRDNINERI